jgi:DNA-binding response OmpR family regulator
MEQNILLVEDEEALRMTLGDRRRREGYAVDCASNGETGFQKATSLPFDLMILDIMLPGHHGLDLCRDIRLAGLGAPILLLTGRSQTVDKIVGLKLGADAYVTKPFDMLELVARVEVLLRREPASKSSTPKADSPRKIAAEHSEVFKSATTVAQGSPVYPVTSQDRKLQEEVARRLASHKDSPQLAEVVPQLRKMLDEEHLSPQMPRDLGFLSVAEGAIEFLEEIFDGIRLPKRRR